MSKTIKSVYYFEDGTVNLFTENPKQVSNNMAPGIYSCTVGQMGMSIRRFEFPERVQPHPSKEANLVLNYIDSFCNEEMHESINNAGFSHKLGVLCHGKQGTGKTTLMNYIANKAIEHKEAVCFYCKSNESFEANLAVAEMVRQSQDSLIIFLMDEFDSFIRGSASESQFKRFLDGPDSIDNCISIACTNYLDKIPKTIKDRPSRFRIIQEIGAPGERLVKGIIQDLAAKLEIDLEEHKDIYKQCKGYTVDEVKNKMLDIKMSQDIPVVRSAIGFNVKEEDEDDEEFDSLVERSGLFLIPSSWTGGEEEEERDIRDQNIVG